MKFIASLLVYVSFLTTSCTHTYYIVRHAEKDTSNQEPKDPALSEVGKHRTETLKNLLKGENIAYVFSTNTIRTRSTAQPVADYFNLAIQIYGPKPDSAVIEKLKKIKKNTLIVGHSNTVKDIVNGLCNAVKVNVDLPDDEYDNIFTVRYIHFLGLHIKFAQRKY